MKVLFPWGKSCDGGRHHLAHHCADVAGCFEVLCTNPIIGRRLNKVAGRNLDRADIARLAVFAFLHDIGKLHPEFQAKRTKGKIGYARVSTDEQNPDLQRDALKQAGCEKVIVDQASGTVAARPGLDKIKELLRSGDTLVVWRLDRLGRSLRDLIAWAAYLEKRRLLCKACKRRSIPPHQQES